MGVATGLEKEPTCAESQQISIHWWIVHIMSSLILEGGTLGCLPHRAGPHFTAVTTGGKKNCRFFVFTLQPRDQRGYPERPFRSILGEGIVS